MINIEHLTKIFFTEEVQTKALNDISLHIDCGEFVAIMGPSGCGKSTLLNVLGTLDSPTSGTYTFDGRRLDVMTESQLSAFRKGRIGFIFQNFNLIDELTVYENVELPLMYMDVKQSLRNEKVDRILAKVNLSHRKNHYPQQLSGGQQQRVAVARAAVADFRLFLADEPNGKLDSRNGLEVMELLRDMNRAGTTVVIVTHSQRDAGFADRIIRLFDGKVIAENTYTDL